MSSNARPRTTRDSDSVAVIAKLVRRCGLPFAILAWTGVALLILWLAGHVIQTLLLLTFAALLAYALSPVVQLLEHVMPSPRHGSQRWNHGERKAVIRAIAAPPLLRLTPEPGNEMRLPLPSVTGNGQKGRTPRLARITHQRTASLAHGRMNGGHVRRLAKGIG